MPATFDYGISDLSRFQLLHEMTAGFANDLDSALNKPSLFPVPLESFERHAFQYAASAFDCFKNICEPVQDDSFGHQNTSTAEASIRFLSRG